MAAPITDADRRNYLQTEVDADLVFVWDEAGVSLQNQYVVAQNYKTIRKFAAIGDTRAEARAAFQADIPIDPAAGAAQRAELACLVTAWQVASEMTDKEIQSRAEARNLGIPRQVTFTDRNALVSAFERVHGRLDDRDTPSADYLSQKVEEVEQGELLASQLDEIGSKDEALTLSIQSSVDSAGRLRITRERKKSKLPTNSEELRAKLKLESNAFVMLGAKFRNRAWFQGLVPNDYIKYVDWLLGEKVFGLQVPRAAAEGTRPLNPPWSILLRFEQQVRKEAYKQAIRQNRSSCPRPCPMPSSRRCTSCLRWRFPFPAKKCLIRRLQFRGLMTKHGFRTSSRRRARTKARAKERWAASTSGMAIFIRPHLTVGRFAMLTRRQSARAVAAGYMPVRFA